MASKTVAQLGEHPHGEVAGSSPAGQFFCVFITPRRMAKIRGYSSVASRVLLIEGTVGLSNTASRGETRHLRGETLQWSVESVERDRTLAIAGWNADEHFRPPGSAVLNRKFAGIAQWVERQISNLNVVGSNPTTRSIFLKEPFSEYGAAW